MSTDQAIEQEIQAKGLTAPRITPADIEAAIASEFYFTAFDGMAGGHSKTVQYVHKEGCRTAVDVPLSLLTFCVLVLRNGFTVTGESACASPENFDAEMGRKIARRNAEAKIWPLREQAERGIVDANQAHQERVADYQNELADAKGRIASFQAALKALGCKEEDEAQ
jgi:hypothetical protein